VKTTPRSTPHLLGRGLDAAESAGVGTITDCTTFAISKEQYQQIESKSSLLIEFENA